MARKLDQSQARLLGSQLRAARQAEALSLHEVATRFGMHHSQLSRLERGHFRRLSDRVQLLSSYLHIRPREIVAGMSELAQLHARIDALADRAPKSVELLTAFLDALDELRSPGRSE